MFKRIGLSFASKVFSAISMFGVSIVLARTLGPENFGLYNLLATLTPLFAYIFVFGQDQYLLSFLSRKNEMYLSKKSTKRIWLSIYLVFSFFLAAFVFVLFLGFSFVQLMSEAYFTVLVSMICGFIFSVRRVFIAYFRVISKEYKGALSESVIYPGLLLLSCSLLYFLNVKDSLNIVYLILVFCGLVSVFSFYSSSILSFKSVQFDFWRLKILTRQGAIFAAITIAEACTFYFDRILVFYNFGSSTLAFYQIALRFVEIILIFESAYLLVSMPKIAMLFNRGIFDELNLLLKKQTVAIFLFNFISSCILYYCAELLVQIYGPEFFEAVILLKVFSVFMILFSLFGPSTFILTVIKEESYALVVSILCMLVFILALVFFGKSMDILGFVILKGVVDLTRRILCTYRLYTLGINSFIITGLKP